MMHYDTLIFKDIEYFRVPHVPIYIIIFCSYHNLTLLLKTYIIKLNVDNKYL